MDRFLKKAKIALSDPGIRNGILTIMLGILVFRFLSAIPVPNVDKAALESLMQQNQFLGLFNLFSGGGLSFLSIVMLGVGPYITASIIMQLSTVLSPKLKSMYHEEGQAGREKFNQISRILTVPIAIIQGLGLILFLANQGVLVDLSPQDMALLTMTVTAGAMLVTWIGELMSEYGPGSGVSILITAGIIASIPSGIKQIAFLFDKTQIPEYTAFAIITLLMIVGIVFVSEAERRIPIIHSKQARIGEVYGQTSSYLPIRVNMAGVMPIIFALSILLFPQFIIGLFSTSGSVFWVNASSAFNKFANNPLWYSLTYFLLVFGFTYFYTAITFDVESVADNLQKSGTFIPGLRPGEHTEEYIAKILSRVTFIGAVFLGLIAVIPIILRSATGNASLAIGGTSILILVAVVVDLIKRIDAQISMREY